MNDRIRNLLKQIEELEKELQSQLDERRASFRYEVLDKRIAFERAIREAHRKLKLGVWPWLLSIPPRNLLTMPMIYSMIVPLLFTDVCVSIYHRICFPIYRIPRVRRSDYIVFDHQHLSYLNFMEKFHCLYCAYANGLIAYVREIVARTEQYFCPIKHARRLRGVHERYPFYLEYGEAEDYQARLDQFRQALAKEKDK